MELSRLAVPSVYAYILVLGWSSLWLLMYLEPGPLTKHEIIAANVAMVLIYITYTKSVFTDPGTIPEDWVEVQERGKQGGSKEDREIAAKTRKWCRKCDAAKPPRAHHCKACKRCIPKMDHHCPWTANCVSHTTFPHFLRFLTYTTMGLSLLESYFFTRLHSLWNARDLPSYLGPSPFQLAHLFAAVITNSITLFAVGILCIRNFWCLFVNTTTIEGWEIQRHETLLRRARHFGGYLEAVDGNAVRIKRQEFPYDIGIFSNIAQGMGSWNPLAWVNPFGGTPPIQSGLVFETNGFEDEGTVWPPPDPDRAYKRPPKAENTDAFTYQNSKLSTQDTLVAFRERQAKDAVRRRRPFVERLEEKVAQVDEDEYVYGDDASDNANEDGGGKEGYKDGEGEEGWRNSEGECLKDFGVDEDIEFYDEQDDEIPLAELMARRRAASNATSALANSS
ncbi:DHHC palmitoyltransferase-domain-containing protein [Phaeosphaeriaceae sp. PMI808]|nr:DHHC palmitoyltransferase-domain-containing protein [Phaeosphaeriaceae sp. PMI808]